MSERRKPSKSDYIRAAKKQKAMEDQHFNTKYGSTAENADTYYKKDRKSKNTGNVQKDNQSYTKSGRSRK